METGVLGEVYLERSTESSEELRGGRRVIEVIGLSKTFKGNQEEVHALRNVSLQIQNGEVFGIIRYSGAGKSTLIRCLNLLEKPTEGRLLLMEKS